MNTFTRAKEAKLWYEIYYIHSEPKEFAEWFSREFSEVEPEPDWPDILHIRYWERRAYALMGWLASEKKEN